MDKRVDLIEKIYIENSDKIYRYFYFHTYNQALAEDLTSKTFMKVIDKISTFNEKKAAVITWLFTIARNTLTDYYRLASTNKTISLETLEPENPDVRIIENVGNKSSEKSVQLDRNKQILQNAILELNEEEQLFIFLRFTQELSYDEIAVELNININTVGVKLHRAIEKVKKMLEKKGDLDKLDQIL
jgi:RNA polymerase sigma-70 factor (ECF subfamily)